MAWRLTRSGDAFAGTRPALVLPVRRADGARLVLKIVPDALQARHEALALAAWRGEGAAKLVAVDEERGGLLLERVIPGDALAKLCATHDNAATSAAAEVIAALRHAAPVELPALPDIDSWTDCLRHDALLRAPAPLRRLAARAAAIAEELLAGAPRSLLHGDLQHFNVLHAERSPWLAIDPKGVLGPPEAEVAALLRNPRRFVLSQSNPRRLIANRLAILAERLVDDARLLGGWAFVLAVAASAWALEDGENETQVGRWLACAEVMEPA